MTTGADDTIIGKFIEDRYFISSWLGKGGGGSCYWAIDKWYQDIGEHQF